MGSDNIVAKWGSFTLNHLPPITSSKLGIHRDGNKVGCIDVQHEFDT